MTILELIRSLFSPKHPPGEGPFAAFRVGAERHPYIAPWMEEGFANLIHASQHGGDFALAPCLVNGEPSACIATVERVGRFDRLTPVFVAVTPGLAVTFPPRAPSGPANQP